MNDKTRGIVIDQIDYKDADAIITVVGQDFKKVSLYVKGYKKITSKNVYATQLFDESEFLFDYQQDKVNILKSASLIDEYAGIKADYEKMCIGSVILEAVKNGVDSEENLYSLLHSALSTLNDTDQPYLVLNLFLARMLDILGNGPFVDGCVVCASGKNIETVSVEEGGFICHDCNNELHHRIKTNEFLKKFRYINKASFEVYDKLLDLQLNDTDLTSMLLQFLMEQSGIVLKSVKSLTNINF